MRKAKQKESNRLPEYEGPICRADGVKARNWHLWPMNGDSWWAGHETDSDFLDRSYAGRWHFSIYALNDDKYAVDGSIFAIRDNETYWGRQCVYETRAAAIRAAAAYIIRVARASRKWKTGLVGGGLTERQCVDFINWARNIVARETGAAKPKPFTVKELPEKCKPKPKPTGLELFDHYELCC